MLTLNDGRSELWQWDTGRTLAVDADCSQVHFSNKVFGRSIDVGVVDGVAIIPDILLQTDKDLNVWAFVGTSENGYTKISKTFKVNRRNKPADYVFTPPDQTSLEEIKEKIDYLESIQDPDAIKNAVADYISKNPITVEETDPTVPAWAKQPQKPAYTAQEVGALPDTTAIPSTATDVNAEPAGSVSQHNVSDAAHNDIRLLIQGLSERLSAVADSDDTTLDQLSEVVLYIKSNRELISAITTDKVSVADIIDNLTTNVANKPLSAAQGVALKALIDAISVPDKLPNPNALTFTGAVTGSYDGSAPLSVEIPSGGGSSSWETVIDTTLTEEAGIDTGEMPGKTEVMCLFAVPKHTKGILQDKKSGAFGASLNGFSMAGSTYGKVGCIYGVKINGHAVQFVGSADTSSAEPTIDLTTRTSITISLFKPNSAANNTPLKLLVSLPAGTQIKVFVR